jgi:rhodanese-related sulfurtransferase
MKRLLLFVMLAGTALLTACGGGAAEPGDSQGNASREAAPATGKLGEKISVPGGSFTRVSPAELKDMLENKDFLFVNTHIPFEGNIPGTDLSIPYNRIGQSLDRLPADKDAKIVLYCRSGRMSAIASKTLVRAGYTNVWDLKGGMEAWEEAGFPLKGARQGVEAA